MTDTIVKLINDFGFPIFAAFGLGYFVYYTWNWVVKEIKPVLYRLGKKQKKAY